MALCTLHLQTFTGSAPPQVRFLLIFLSASIYKVHFALIRSGGEAVHRVSLHQADIAPGRSVRNQELMVDDRD